VSPPGEELCVNDVGAEAGTGALQAGSEVGQLTQLLHLILQELPLQEIRQVGVLLLCRQPAIVMLLIFRFYINPSNQPMPSS